MQHEYDGQLAHEDGLDADLALHSLRYRQERHLEER